MGQTLDIENVAQAGAIPLPALRTCPACAETGVSAVNYAPDPWDLGACDACNFVYLRNPPAYEALEEEYAWEKTYKAKKSASRGSSPLSPLNRWLRAKLPALARDRTAAFRRWFGQGKVLDIGCGNGAWLPEPMVPFGIELSKGLHEVSDALFRKRGGYCVHAPGAEGIFEFPESHFDGILMRSYLEHETEPLKVLQGARRCIKPDGAMFVRVPNYGSLNRRVMGAKWCGFRHPDHVNYFTLDALRSMAAKTGFTVEVTNSVLLPIDDNINALLRPALS